MVLKTVGRSQPNKVPATPKRRKNVKKQKKGTGSAQTPCDLYMVIMRNPAIGA
jgi:hypothetical protein